MMKRRTDTLLSPQALFDECTYQPMQWPWKTVRLERNSLIDYRQRSMSAHISVAELYHENTKLFPQMLPELTVSLVRSDEVRLEFLRRRAARFGGDDSAALGIKLQLRELLTAISKSTEPELFYAIEVLVVEEEMLLSQEPLSDALQLVKRLSAADLDMLRRALHLMDEPEAPPEKGPLVIILGCFARNEILFAARGYRRTLLEGGRVAQQILEQAKRFNLALSPFYDFHDRDVDSVLGADGTEVASLLVFELKGDIHVG